MQLKFNANLNSAGFPLWTTLQGRTVLVGRLDQSKVDASNSSTNKNLIAKETGAPEALYMHNVVPTTQGYKSVSFELVIDPHTEVEKFIDILTIRNGTDTISFMATTESGKYFLYDTISNIWVDVTPANTGSKGITSAFVSGVTYIAFKFGGVYKVDIPALLLEEVTLVGLDTSRLLGIAASNNYLIVYDSQTVYWSAALDHLDFVPSTITGAGSGVPTELKGIIVAVGELSTGFAVYSNSNIVVASFSGNVRYPWIFKEAANGAGIEDLRSVSFSGENGTNYAWSTAGLLRVALTGAVPLLPEISDFLAGKIMEDFDSVTDTLTSSYLTDPLRVELLYSGSRYLVISYGITELTHCLVYDTALKRMGKLKFPHVKVFDLKLDLNKPPVRFIDLTELRYGQLAFPYNAINIPITKAADPKKSLAFLQADGCIHVAVFDFGDFTADSVLLLGKYQLVRSNWLSLQGVEIEAIDSGNSNFSLEVVSSIDGKTLQAPETPYLEYNTNKVKRYLCDYVGKNHSILIKGAFNLVSMDLTITQHGRE